MRGNVIFSAAIKDNLQDSKIYANLVYKLFYPSDCWLCFKKHKSFFFRDLLFFCFCEFSLFLFLAIIIIEHLHYTLLCPSVHSIFFCASVLMDVVILASFLIIPMWDILIRLFFRGKKYLCYCAELITIHWVLQFFQVLFPGKRQIFLVILNHLTRTIHCINVQNCILTPL